MMTCSWWISILVAYPAEKKYLDRNETFRHYAYFTFLVAFGAHGGLAVFIFAIIIPTRLLVRTSHMLPSPLRALTSSVCPHSLAQAENNYPVLTLLTTGAVFPFLAFILRKVLVGVSQRTCRSRC